MAERRPVSPLECYFPIFVLAGRFPLTHSPAPRLSILMPWERNTRDEHDRRPTDLNFRTKREVSDDMVTFPFRQRLFTRASLIPPYT